MHKVFEMFKATGEIAAADPLSGYIQGGNIIPPFADILYDIDCLFKVNRISNALDIVNNLNMSAFVKFLWLVLSGIIFLMVQK